MPIPALPLFKHRDTVVTPADQNQFITQFETTMDTMSNDVIPAINDAIVDINTKTVTATTARDESVSAKNIAVAAKDEALTAVATLQEGAIDDTIIAPNKAFSNQFITNNYYKKTEVNDFAVKLTGNQTIDDNKTFLKSPIVPTPMAQDNSTKVATTAYVDGKMARGVPVAAAGTSIDFVGIPSWAKRITVMFDGISTNGSSNILVQIGDSEGIKTTGYSGSISSGTATLGFSTGFNVQNNITSSVLHYGSVCLNLFNTNNEWLESSIIGATTVYTSIGSGSKILNSTLNRLRITTVNGTDTFDAGSINIIYEG